MNSSSKSLIEANLFKKIFLPLAKKIVNLTGYLMSYFWNKKKKKKLGENTLLKAKFMSKYLFRQNLPNNGRDRSRKNSSKIIFKQIECNHKTT